LYSREFEEISAIEEENLEAKMNAPKVAHLPSISSTEKVNLFIQARINVPLKEETMYKELIYKHHHVFSKSKS
jgi:hypothetical protein